MTGFLLSITATIVLIIQQYSSNRTGVIIAIGIIIFCFAVEYVYKKTEKKTKS